MNYDLIVCGTGFASSFFLRKWLERRPGDRVLVLERGGAADYAAQVAARRVSAIDPESLYQRSGAADKTWLFTVALGGGSNCWWGQTPRMLEEDFQLKTRFGVGYDWPIGYDDLEYFYEEAERAIIVAGPQQAPYRRRTPCPQPMHRVSSFDERMMRRFPDGWYPGPTARASTPTGRRNKCCANGVCGLCPVDAKFRVMNELAALYRGNPNVTLVLGAEVTHVDIQAGAARGVVWRTNGREQRAQGDTVFLGLNALFNPNVLLRSGDTSPLTGRRLYEQASKYMTVDFADVDNFDGGTHITALGYMFYRGEQRRRRGAVLIENHNAPAALRPDKGKWMRSVLLKVVAENLPEDRNRVHPGDRPTAEYFDHSAYAVRALDEVPNEIAKMLAGVVEVERVAIRDEINLSEGHIQGTTVMSASPADGVVDHALRHHRIANLFVGGSGTYPSGPPTNPSLTIAALSLRSASLVA